MMSDHVQVTRDGGVLSIVLNRPERRNAITVAMYAALAEAIRSAGDDPAVRLITIHGTGADFTAGNDLMDFMAEARPEAIDDLPVGHFLMALANNEVPLIAAVHGNAIGIGTTMLLHCDLVLADEDACFKMPFVELGLVPEAASSLILPRLSGRRGAARMLLLGERFGAAQAKDWGIVSHVVPSGGLDETLAGVVATLLSRPPEALRLTQRLLRAADREAVVERITLESGHFGERLQSDEIKQAISAFFAARSGAPA
ncbi:MAG: enoyl-CoA hydratase [Sphingomicrobium sp.]